MYYKKVDLNSNKECFEFLTKHYTYDTMNSWNGLRSIANNVKIYNLPVDYDDAMEALERDDYFTINQTIKDWEIDHPGTSVGFNGRSGGYLVLYNDKGYCHIFNSTPCSPCKYDDYESWKEDVQDYYGSLKDYHSELVEQVKLVQDFDKLCDDLIEVVKYLIEELKTDRANTHKFKCVKTLERYTYETPEDFEAHKKYMEQRHYHLYESCEDDTTLWAEYEMNESDEGEVIYEKTDD